MSKVSSDSSDDACQVLLINQLFTKTYRSPMAWL